MHEMWAVLQCEVYIHVHMLPHSLINHYLVYDWNKVLSWGIVNCCTIHCTCNIHTMYMYTVDCVHDQNVEIHNASLITIDYHWFLLINTFYDSSQQFTCKQGGRANSALYRPFRLICTHFLKNIWLQTRLQLQHRWHH